jgi:hypothetical protein
MFMLSFIDTAIVLSMFMLSIIDTANVLLAREVESAG